ncbi:MAG TPA: GTP-binding protein [Hyphomicrobiales bacterium]|nr:GTP-binding protein [Hyphomicrobiales bacterium]
MTSRIPVTVVTGFLGSGKTTLLNRILGEAHGQRIAVIENEFGEVGVDQDLVINAEEEIFEMNNGCICCTVRGDLIRILGNLAKRRDRFDRVLLETTGMADPGPVAQTFFVDDEIKEHFELDGILTLVDAKHLLLHLDESDEALSQIAFADRLLLNKIDLVTPGELAEVKRRLQGINAMATILEVRMAEAPLEALLGLGGFDLQRALQARPEFLQPEYPFEWAGLYDLKPGRYVLSLAPGPDPSLDLYLLPLAEAGGEALQHGAEQVFRHFSEPAESLAPGATLQPRQLLALQPPATGRNGYVLTLDAPAMFAMYLQHQPQEFELRLMQEDGREAALLLEQKFNGAHSHDDSVTSVAIEAEGTLHEKLFLAWIGTLLRRQGQDIFRSKGIVSLLGEEHRYVFQGVHMLLEGARGEPWGNEPRFNRLVFIGRNLNRDYLEEGFQLCLV